MSLRAQRTAELFTALDTVETNGQAQDAAARAIGHGLAAADRFSYFTPDPSHVYAKQEIEAGVADVQRLAEPFSQVDLSMPLFAAAAWRELRKAIGRLYGTLWAVEDVLAGDTELGAWLDFIGSVSADAVRAFPKVTQGALDYAREAAAPILGFPKDLLVDVLKNAWPFLLLGAALLGGGIYLAVKHPRALAAVMA